MTLRVEISIVPFGEEANKRVIETLNISNVTPTRRNDERHEYVIEHNEYKNYSLDTPRVSHYRPDGALWLVRRALERVLDGE